MSTADPTAVAEAQATILENQPAAATGQSTGDAASDGTKTTGKILGKFADQAALEKAYTEVEKLARSSTRIPDEKASAEEWAKFYQKVGRPEAADGYELETTDEPGADEGSAGWFRKIVHELGLTKKQAEGFWKASQGWAKEIRKGYADKIVKDREAQVTALTAKWGDNYALKLADAHRVALRFGGQPFLKLLRETRLGDNPVMLETLAAMREVLSEDVLKGGTVGVVESRDFGAGWYPNSPELK